MADWYYLKDGEQKGPLDDEALLDAVGNGTVAHTDLIWCEGMGDWQPAAELMEFEEADAEPAAEADRRSSRSPGRLERGLVLSRQRRADRSGVDRTIGRSLRRWHALVRRFDLDRIARRLESGQRSGGGIRRRFRCRSGGRTEEGRGQDHRSQENRGEEGQRQESRQDGEIRRQESRRRRLRRAMPLPVPSAPLAPPRTTATGTGCIPGSSG